jgi:hypothetical protein
MGEIIHLSRERITITLYTRGLGRGKQAHPDNERSLAVIVGVVRELGPWYFEVRTRSWPAHFYETIFRGGWWSPVVVVGHTIFSQAGVPDRAQLRAYLNEQMHILRPRLAKSS